MDNSFGCNDLVGGKGAGRFLRSIGVARLLCDGLLAALCCNDDGLDSIVAAPNGAGGALPFLCRGVVDVSDDTEPYIVLFLDGIETFLK